MTLTSAGSGAAAVVTVTGRLDAMEAPVLRAELGRLITGGIRDLVVDLADVEFVDSAGLAVLVRARRDLRAVGSDVVLVRPATEDAMRVFRLTQFDEVFLMVDARPAQ